MDQIPDRVILRCIIKDARGTANLFGLPIGIFVALDYRVSRMGVTPQEAHISSQL